MRILVITRAAWLRENAVGNTLYEFFSEFSDFEIYSLCLREAHAVCKIPEKNFYISESRLAKNLLCSAKVGDYTENYVDEIVTDTNGDQKIYDKVQTFNSTALRIARELVWDIGNWKNPKLDAFLEEANPDVIFTPVFPCIYAHKVLDYVRRNTKAAVAIFHADDCYTFRQFSLSPLFWIYRGILRKYVRKTVKHSDLQYVISDVQKTDYDKAFKLNHKILTKFGDFSAQKSMNTDGNIPYQIVYTGNIFLNRWKSLAKISKALVKINENGTVAQLRIYTANKVTDKERKLLDVPESSFIMGKIPASKVDEVQNNADILVHVESFDLRSRLRVRQSFSTKIVDYLKRHKPILVVGPKEVASVKYFIDNNCGFVAENDTELVDIFNKVLFDKKHLSDYADRAYNVGLTNHNKETVLKMLHDDLCNLQKNGHPKYTHIGDNL